MNDSNTERDRLWSLSQELMLAAGLNGIIRATNPSWASVLGWSEAELRGTNFLDLVHAEDRQKSVDQAAQLASGIATVRLDNRYRHKDGSYRWISWTAVADAECLYAIGRDMTARTPAVEQKSDERNFDALGRFAGVVAHDFNNVLQGIVGSLELVRKLIKLKRSEDTEKFIGTAMSSARRAAALTERLQAFSSRGARDPRPVEVNKLIEAMQESLQAALTPSVSIERTLASEGWTTLCDSRQLENAILHLVTNSRDAMPDGGIIAIETSNATMVDIPAAGADTIDPGHYVCIAVADTGTGMSEQAMRQVFDPLFTTKKTGLVSGLGLSTVHGFARQLQGHIAIQSEVGRGTTVKLYLPRHLENDAGTPRRD
jgi:PAS domain S-box-containing protein